MSKLPTKKELKNFLSFIKATYGKDINAMKRCSAANFEISPEQNEKFDKIFYKCLEEVNRADFS